MNITDFPTELLPAFCRDPFAGLMLRLTCADFVARIPPPRELFKQVNTTAWANGFWLLHVVERKGTTDVRHLQYRKCDSPEPDAEPAPISGHVYVHAPAPTEVYVRWNNAEFMWSTPRSVTYIRHDIGLDRVENPSKIYTLQGTYYAGTIKKFSDVYNAIDKKGGREVIIAFEKSVDFGRGISNDVLFVAAEDADKFIGCEYDHKIFRRKAPPSSM